MRARLPLLLLLSGLASLVGAQGPLLPVPSLSPATVTLSLEPLVTDLRLPVYATTDGRGDDPERLYVVQLEGLVRVFEHGAVRPTPFLDLRGRVTGLEGEDGFYTIAFHPDFARNGRLFAAYTRTGSNDLVVVEYRAEPDLRTADPARYERVLLTVPVDEAFHHGGQLAFGPDGMLYVSTGDGQEQNHWLHEPPFVSQDVATLRGKILRIDVDHGDPYAVPADNPFVGVDGARGEIWARGLRNPWKFSFDPADDSLWAGDVGNDRWEEIDRVVPGGNYGWPIREGPECQAYPQVPGLVDEGCADLAFGGPVAAYGHLGVQEGGGNAVVGGYVYRGTAQPALAGRYLFGDFVSGRVWSLAPAPDGWRLEHLLDTGHPVSSFARDGRGELYLITIDGGLYRIQAR